MSVDPRVVERFFQVLVEEIRAQRPEYLGQPFTVAEIYQSLVPYRSHRDRIGVELNGDYEEALLRLLGGGDPPYLKLESEPARERIRREVASKNPNTGIFREYAALDVRIAPERRDELPAAPAGPASSASPDRTPGNAVTPHPEAEEEAGQADVFAAAPGTTLTAGTGRSAEAGAPGSGIPREEVADMRGTPGPISGSPPPAPENCPECERGLPSRDGLRFCPFCGTDVHRVACASCGEELERGWAFCVACGEATGS